MLAVAQKVKPYSESEMQANDAPIQREILKRKILRAVNGA
jgi:hypothetical protein